MPANNPATLNDPDDDTPAKLHDCDSGPDVVEVVAEENRCSMPTDSTEGLSQRWCDTPARGCPWSPIMDDSPWRSSARTKANEPRRSAWVKRARPMDDDASSASVRPTFPFSACRTMNMHDLGRSGP